MKLNPPPLETPIDVGSSQIAWPWKMWLQTLYTNIRTTITSVSGTGNIASSGGNTPVISFTGTLPIVNGGTNGTATPTAGGVTYGTGSALAYSAAGTTGQLLTSAGTGAPAWETLSAGDGISITNTAGTITISDTLNSAHIEAYDLSASIALSATPILLTPASTSSGAVGITYNSTTGVFTFANAGGYSLSLVLSAVASAAGQFLYLYQETWNGSAWVPNANSGKYLQLLNNQVTQIVATQAIYRAAGSQVRYWIYSNSNKVTLQTFTLPGIVPVVYTPAIRIQYAS